MRPARMLENVVSADNEQDNKVYRVSWRSPDPFTPWQSIAVPDAPCLRAADPLRQGPQRGLRFGHAVSQRRQCGDNLRHLRWSVPVRDKLEADAQLVLEVHHHTLSDLFADPRDAGEHGHISGGDGCTAGSPPTGWTRFSAPLWGRLPDTPSSKLKELQLLRTGKTIQSQLILAHVHVREQTDFLADTTQPLQEVEATRP